MTCDEFYHRIAARLGPQAHQHLGIDAPARRDTAIAGGSYRAPGTLVDGFRAGDADVPLTGVVVTPQATSEVLQEAVALGANLVISRQAFLADSLDRPVGRPEPALAAKLQFIADHGLVVLRLQDARTGPISRQIAAALPAAIGLHHPLPGIDLATGLVYRLPPRPVRDIALQLKAAQSSSAFRLVGDAAMPVHGIAFATETSRPTALARLLTRPDVHRVIAGEVHETESTAYVLDAIALGQPKALLLVGAVAMDEAPARQLASWLTGEAGVPVHYRASPQRLHAL